MTEPTKTNGEIKRWASDHDDGACMMTVADGNFVTHADHIAAIAALRAENERLNVECEWTAEEHVKLQAENADLAHRLDRAAEHSAAEVAEAMRLREENARLNFLLTEGEPGNDDAPELEEGP